MARPTVVAWAEQETSSADGYTTMPVSIPASRAVDDLMLCWVGSHSGSVDLPAGFTELSRPSGGTVLGYAISTVAGGGTATATSSGGSHGVAVLALFRGAEEHALSAEATFHSNEDSLPVAGATSAAVATPTPVVGFVGSFSGQAGVGPGNGLHVVLALHRFTGLVWDLYQGGTFTFFSPAPTAYLSSTVNWGGCWWSRDADDAPAVDVYTSASTNQMVAWNVLFA